MNGNRDLVVALLAMAVVFTRFCGAAFVLQPLDRAAKAKRALVQFTILDFLSLTAYFAVPLAVVAHFAKNQPGSRDDVTIQMISGCFIAWIIWWGSVRTAAKAGV